MAVQQKPRPISIPPAGTYVTDCDRKELFRIEAIHPEKGVVLENARTCVLFMLTVDEYQKSGFKELG